MNNLSGIFDNNSQSVISWAANTLSSIAGIITAIETLKIVKESENRVDEKGVIIKAAKSAADTPFVGWLLVGAAIASTMAAISAIPKMANGGVVYGNSLVNVGEYAGANSNPEVIAPLSKLKNLLHNDNDTSNNGGEVRFKIDGTTLIGVLSNYNKKISKVR
jgi:hypothetical protein